ncbi:ATP-binding cassette domain-containing protein [Actinomyces faecalis]|uniref:ATP-binding cassette domain-containing protein n=1 Tax=Actinomyces faecalis TaxID=2722820 RepID=UPI001F32E4B5|nr:ATP-binding cassette domain-containing protein [Actinomyces faecalis]
MTTIDAEDLLSSRRVLEQMGCGPELRLEGVGHAYGWLARHLPHQEWPLRELSVTFRPGVITGLLGRNGTGKSTLLSVASGLRRPVTGQVTLNGHPVWDHAAPRSAITLLGTRRSLMESHSLTASFRIWELTRPLWQTREAERYLHLLGVDPDSIPARLSQGQRSAVDAAFALASHSPVLLLDEVHLGMDAVIRRRFWDTLLEQYTYEHPTIIIASHEVSEIENLLEDVVILGRAQGGNRVVACGGADELRQEVTPPGMPLANLTDVLEHVSRRTP